MVDASGIWGRFAATWEMTMDPSLPGMLRPRGRRFAPRAYCFPLLGALLGGVVALCGAIVSAAFNPVAGAFIFALLGTAFWELKDSGRESALLFSFLARRFRGDDSGEALAKMSSSWNIFQTPPASMLLMAMELLRFSLLFSLSFYGAALWLWVIVTGVFTVQGYLALCPQRGGNPPLVVGNIDDRNRMWIAFAVAVLLVLWNFPMGALVAVLAVVLAARWLAHAADEELGGVTPDFVTLAGGVAGYLLLLVGILFSLTMN